MDIQNPASNADLQASVNQFHQGKDHNPTDVDPVEREQGEGRGISFQEIWE